LTFPLLHPDQPEDHPAITVTVIINVIITFLQNCNSRGFLSYVMYYDHSICNISWDDLVIFCRHVSYTEWQSPFIWLIPKEKQWSSIIFYMCWKIYFP
jgi:hypothetical protein